MELDKDTMGQLSTLFGNVLGDYYNYYGKDIVNVECTLSNKLSDTFMEKRPDYFEGDVKTTPEAIDINRGTIIPPIELDGKFMIVINSNYFLDSLQKKDYQWTGTLIHELTHVLDFIQYAKINHLDSYDVIQRDMEHRPFMLWTECNARAKGYFFIRKYVFGDKVNDKYDTDQTDYILQTELPYQINVFANGYSEVADNSWQQMYVATQFLGRYSIWEELFPNVFTKSLRRQVMGTNQWVMDLYLFFLNNRELETANQNWKEMLEIMRSNWKGI